METVRNFILGGSKITADGDCNCEIKRHWLLGRKAITNLPGSSVPGILQAKILEWVAISFSRGSSWPRDQTRISSIVSRCFTIWATREVITNLECTLNSRDVTLPTKAHLVKAMIFPIVMSGCESGNIKKAEHQRIDAFELWCWRRLLRVPWTARRSN